MTFTFRQFRAILLQTLRQLLLAFSGVKNIQLARRAARFLCDLHAARHWSTSSWAIVCSQLPTPPPPTLLLEILPGQQALLGQQSKHTSCYIQAYFDANKINWWRSPAEPWFEPNRESVGINEELLERQTQPTEHDWVQEKDQEVLEDWPDTCSRYVDHLQRFMPDAMKVNVACGTCPM